MTQRDDGPSILLAIEVDRTPSVGLIQAGNDVQQRRLAAAGAPDDGQRLAARLRLKLRDAGNALALPRVL
jgi:hypothetical protein